MIVPRPFWLMGPSLNPITTLTLYNWQGFPCLLLFSPPHHIHWEIVLAALISQIMLISTHRVVPFNGFSVFLLTVTSFLSLVLLNNSPNWPYHLFFLIGLGRGRGRCLLRNTPFFTCKSPLFIELFSQDFPLSSVILFLLLMLPQDCIQSFSPSCPELYAS